MRVDAQARDELATAVAPSCPPLTVGDRADRVAGLAAASAPDGDPDDEFLGGDGVREIVAGRDQVGSHAESHRILGPRQHRCSAPTWWRAARPSRIPGHGCERR